MPVSQAYIYQKKMIRCDVVLEKYGSNGDKTGWTFITLKPELVAQLRPGFNKSFRVKGMLDDHRIEAVAILTVGDGNFILPVNATMRKALSKQQGANVSMSLEEDTSIYETNPELMVCLADEPAALQFFEGLQPSHQRYFSTWIDNAKSEVTRTRRLARVINALQSRMTYSDMLRMKD